MESITVLQEIKSAIEAGEIKDVGTAASFITEKFLPKGVEMKVDESGFSLLFDYSKITLSFYYDSDRDFPLLEVNWYSRFYKEDAAV